MKMTRSISVLQTLNKSVFAELIFMKETDTGAEKEKSENTMDLNKTTTSSSSTSEKIIIEIISWVLCPFEY